VAVTEIHDDNVLLIPAEVVSLQRTIEAGVLARAAYGSGDRPLDATDEELIMLAELGERARQRFIRANLRLVAMVARQSAFRSDLSEADLFQEGCVGLITAVERFDYARGYRFSTYALFWIRAYVCGSAARHLGAMNLPTSRAEQLRAARGVEAELAQRLGRTPTVGEVADALGRNEEWTAGLLAHQRPQSLETLDGAVADRLGQPDAYAVGDFAHPVRELLWRLEDLDRQVLELRLGFADGEPRSFAHTARTLAISVSRVRRLEARALETLRGICPQQASAHLSG
jgi:RNA polymerase primary sigma factor/RNA polymerase nonessential primary-like sigma factor